MTDNMKLWQSVERTPVEHTKKITGKSYQGNSPKPHYLVHKATETFGPCGIGWGFQILDERIEEGAGGAKLHIARVKVWYEWNGKRGEVEHIGGTEFSGMRSSGKAFTDEDAPKKSVTDALVKALSMIGFAGDIFMGRYDDSKYMQELHQEAANETRQEQPKAAKPISAAENKRQLAMIDNKLVDCRTPGDVTKLLNFWADEAEKAGWSSDYWNEARRRFARRKKELEEADDTVSAIQDQFPGATVTNERLHA